MSLNKKIEIDRFDGGLITDIESAKLPGSAASRLENADIRNRFLETLPGVAEANTGLPAGFIKLSEEQFKFTSPSEQNCVLVHGTLSGVHKLYVRPYLSLAGAWVDSWLDLTEFEGPYTDSVVAGTSLQSSSMLNGSTADYYKSGIILCTTFGNEGTAVVTAYNQSTKTHTLSWAIPGFATGNTFYWFRNPIYLSQGTSLFSPSSNGCRFLQRNNVIDIVTGSDYGYAESSGTIKTDFWLGVLNSYGGFDDPNLDFTGFYLTRKAPAAMYNGNPPMALSDAAIGAGEQQLAVVNGGKYIVVIIPEYDHFQDAPLYPGDTTPYDGTAYSVGTYNPSGPNIKLKIDLSIYFGVAGVSTMALRRPQKNAADADDFIIFDRRITKLSVYMVTAASIGSAYRPGAEWRLVKDVSIDDSAWSGTGPNYTQTIYITGDLFDANEGVDIPDRQGHNSLKIFANANYVVSAKKRVAVANVFTDERRQSFVFFSAINSDVFNTPDVIPHTSFLDLSLYGIPKIVGFIEALGFYVAFGENQIVKIDAGDLSVERNIQARGLCSSNAITNTGGLIYFSSLDDIYYFHPAAGEPRSITTGYIREAWRTIATATKQAAAIGYDSRYNMLVIAAGSTIYLYNLPAAYADTLARDTQAVGAWSVYSVNKTFTRFYTDLTGKCIGIASDGKAYEFFSSGVANSLVYEKVLGETNLNVSGLRLTYEATAAITAKIFDMARNASFPIKTYRFPAQSLHRRVDIFKGAQTRKPKLRIEASVGTKISQVIINPDILSDDH